MNSKWFQLRPISLNDLLVIGGIIVILISDHVHLGIIEQQLGILIPRVDNIEKDLIRHTAGSLKP